MGTSSKMVAHVTTSKATRDQNLQMTPLRYGIEFGIIIVGANSLGPIVDASRRGLTRYFLDVSDVRVALLIDSVPELLFGPSCVGKNLCALGVQDKDMWRSGNPIPFYLVCYRLSEYLASFYKPDRIISVHY